MSQSLPSFLEDQISQIPALQLLMNLGWRYLTPSEAVTLRSGKRVPLLPARNYAAISKEFVSTVTLVRPSA
jgi:hypothetical protein